MKTAVLIPAYNPDERLIKFVKKLAAENIDRIIVVNDGSDQEKKNIFNSIKKIKNAVLLEHAVNMGKGAALKTGMNYFYLHCAQYAGIITADADGQHTAAGIKDIINEMDKNPGQLVLGVRNFKEKGIPFRSVFGNVITKYVFFFLTGLKVTDTQTGLRGIPRAFIPRILKISTNGFDYEIEVLLSCKRYKMNIVQKNIDTIYLDKNVSSHFNPFFDSFKIYFVFFRFAFSSLICFIIDYFGFLFIYSLSNNVFISTYSARFVSFWVNYLINKNAVFHYKKKSAVPLIKYLILVVIVAAFSSILTSFSHDIVKIPIALSKIIADTLLYFANFTIQRDYIFSDPDE
jgi:putative flippase GtrA